MTLDIFTSLILFATGLVAGAISSIAGGSAIISFPVLLGIGLPPVVANATNFTAVLPSNLAALPAYLLELKQRRRMACQMVVTGLLGGALGSILLLYTSNANFEAMVPWLMLSATVLYVAGGRVAKWVSVPSVPATGLHRPWHFLVVFLVSIYGGYFGAGLGVIFLAVFAVMGLSDFHVANALKNLTNSMIGFLGVVIYAASDLISWPHAVFMMIGSALGGYGGIRLSQRVPKSWLANSIVVLGILLTGYYFWAD